MPPDARFARWLAAAAAAYSLCHHVGSLPGGLGEVGPTRWADWIDVATPFLVLLPAAAALAAGAATRRQWLAFALGAIGYVEGHGIHLSANSIGNVAPGDAVHLWDEVAGHWIWYAGAAVVMGVLATAARDRPRPRGAAALLALVLAANVGGTWATNAFGGGTAPGSLLVALALTAYGWRHRSGLGVWFAAGFALSAVMIATWMIMNYG